MDEKIFKVLAAIFAIRSKEYVKRGDFVAASVYDNAFDMLSYAVKDRWDCLLEFDWAIEATDLIEKVGTDIDFWDLEELIKGE